MLDYRGAFCAARAAEAMGGGGTAWEHPEGCETTPEYCQAWAEQSPTSLEARGAEGL